MKLKERVPSEDVIFSPKTTEESEVSKESEANGVSESTLSFKKDLSRENEIADLDVQIMEFDSLPKSKFNIQKRKEIEAHRKELVKAQQDEEKAQIKLAEAKRKEEERRVKWSKKAVDAETQTKIAEERQKEALTKDRKRRARRRKVDKVFDIFGKIIFVVFLVIAVLCLSNDTVRERVAITFNNIGELIGSWVSGDETPSNKTLDDALKGLGTELNDINTNTSNGEGFTIENQE
jgi:Fe2+ transport system protein B